MQNTKISTAKNSKKNAEDFRSNINWKFCFSAFLFKEQLENNRKQQKTL